MLTLHCHSRCVFSSFVLILCSVQVSAEMTKCFGRWFATIFFFKTVASTLYLESKTLNRTVHEQKNAETVGFGHASTGVNDSDESEIK